MGTRALALCGGLGHPEDEIVPALEELFADIEAFTDLEAGLAALDADRHDVLVIAALAFTMAADRYDAVRDEWAFSLSTDGRRAITDWVEAGHPVLVLHTGIISFDDWDGWPSITGGRWVWGTSYHPPIGEITVDPADGDEFAVVDERYSDLDMSDDVEVMATSDGQSVAWRRVHGAGRVAVDLLGHDRRSLAHPAHRALLRRQVDWLTEASTS